ncbi:cation-translocating P-type ATPase [Anaeromyxobacter terrae]|uniref:cation-translocating P-type ATPase n=1 Tax=Anaeromyxobacter terrae TaxID=2925406 RepID=UPI001F5780F5|nr:cation-transporting P-type ATPase [Anaeromyxobacter sp. SG22]
MLVNGAFGAWQEHRAERALEALESLVPRRARVVRAGAPVEIPAAAVVPGDVLVLEEGDRVAADARVLSATLLRLDVSLLTGESLPVERDARPCPPGQAIADATCLAPAGATVASGRARALVFATGPGTELGRLARLATATRRQPSTLEVQVARLVRVVTVIAVGMGGAVFALLALLGAAPGESLLFAIGILVANVPEGLLPTITVTLATNVQRMARRRALVRRLSAVETLGAVDVVCTDKTGTLTRNVLAARELWTWDGSLPLPGGGSGGDATLALSAAALASDARGGPGAHRGDPIDRALLDAARAAGLDPDGLARACPRVAELPFDARRRRATALVRTGPALGPAAAAPCAAITKGAPRAVLERCTAVLAGGAARPLDDAARARVIAAEDGLAARGLRVIAVSLRAGGAELAALPLEAVERDLTLLALFAFEDPPRPGVSEALATCRRAGVTVTVVTGDHALTARAIAEEVGLWSAGARVVEGPALDALDDRAVEDLLSAGAPLVFARAIPEQKLRLVRAYQRLGRVVAVTGDGVNDAPALHAAHVGVAMGQGGTDVARAAADVVLLDDDFSSLVAAIEEGRATFANARKFLAYVLTSNVPEIVPFLAMAALRIPPALGILQILAIDLGTDMLPALALGAEPPEPGAMRVPPRPRARRLLDAAVLLRAYGVLGLAEAAACMAAFAGVWHGAGLSLGELQAATPALLAHTAPAALAATERTATTAAFAAIVCCQVGNVLACRSEREPALRAHRPGPLLLAGILAELLLLAAIVYAPPLQAVFGTAPLPAGAWPWLAGCAPAMLAVDALAKRARRRAGAIRATARGPQRANPTSGIAGLPPRREARRRQGTRRGRSP